MAQRVLIAGAVSTDPDLIIADEPTTALDVTVQAEVLDLLRDLQAERHMAMLLVTHNFGVVADLCDRVIVMQSGPVRRAGPRPRRSSTDARAPVHAALLDAILDEGTPRPARRRSAHSAVHEKEHGIADDPTLAARRQGPRRRVPGQGLPRAAVPGAQGRLARHPPGETVGLVGESGSGKTTLGRAVLGLAPVTGGTISYRGQDIAHLQRERAPRRCPARSRWSSRTRTRR